MHFEEYFLDVGAVAVNQVDVGPLYVIAVSTDRAVSTYHTITHTPDVTVAASRPFHRLIKDLEAGVGHERSVKQRVALGAHHSVVHKWVTGGRRADGQVVVLDSRVVCTVHGPSDRHHVAFQHCTTELPEQHQLHSELGESRTFVETHALERRKLQHIFQVDVQHVQPVDTILGRQVNKARQQRYLRQ